MLAVLATQQTTRHSRQAMTGGLNALTGELQEIASSYQILR